ncbi:MAG: hypothetical protein FWC95_08330 [Defluviitaleaceae bacterium]|nr:hypothetical protein [Defluviitaleaceae bacterium]
MNKDPYYLAYEKRYKATYAAGAARWGHPSDEPGLFHTLSEWALKHGLIDLGKRVIEFACGEGGSGVILSRLGCIYHGVDIARGEGS